MGGQELQALEEKIEKLLNHCAQLRRERSELLAKNQDQVRRIKELDEQVAEFQGEREEIRRRVSGLISRIDELGDAPPPGDEGTVLQHVAAEPDA